MPNILDEILANKRVEVEQARLEYPVERLRVQGAFTVPTRNFYGAVVAPQARRPNLIAEVKRSSPSAGLIREDFDPVALARMYEEAGARALSVLTDRKYFDGRLEFIAMIKEAVGLPVLRKDFIVDPYQLYESRAAGADAVLLIAEALPPPLMRDCVELARKLELSVLAEVHTREALLQLLAAVPNDLRGSILIGINNRDLKTQTIDLATTEHVAELVPPGMPIVSESGIKLRRDVDRLHHAGARALLVGETLMRAPDPRVMIRQLFA